MDACNGEIAASRNEQQAYRYLPLTVTEECSGTNACLATCVKHTSCPTLQWVMLGGRTDPGRTIPEDAGTFMACLEGCYDLSREQ